MVSVKVKYSNPRYKYGYPDISKQVFSADELAVWLIACFQGFWVELIRSIEFDERYSLSAEQISVLKTKFDNHHQLREFLENVELTEIYD
jgi:hypothetical protein